MAENKKTRDRLQDLRATSDADLTVVIANAHKNIYQFRKDRLSKPVEDVKVVKNSRKEIARALTIQRERELAQSNEG
ncbi:MAG: 50S ribosomal protein L29 [Capsulimonas sp.]|jgi:ribosomal protein L29|uniref:50S ribosomal protein L29 n=1 Tax=Capsulimonas sp. TaxID=2494211 RepID=UPI00326756E3|nr:Ribosomal protein [Capsulimonas sp.]